MNLLNINILASSLWARSPKVKQSAIAQTLAPRQKDGRVHIWDIWASFLTVGGCGELSSMSIYTVYGIDSSCVHILCIRMLLSSCELEITVINIYLHQGGHVFNCLFVIWIPWNIVQGCGMEVFWKLVKGELRQQLMSYAEELNVDWMLQGDQKVEQYTNANRVAWATVTPKSEAVSHSIPV